MKIKTIFIIVLFISADFIEKGVQKTPDELERSRERIVGGRRASRKEWPFMMVVTLGPVAVCGGSLIKPDVVLTAAHCLDRPPDLSGIISGAVAGVVKIPISTQVDFTDWNTTGTDLIQNLLVPSPVFPKGTNIYRCGMEVVHKKYSSLTIENDIALMLLSNRVVLIDGVGLAKIRKQKPNEFYKCVIAGYGMNKFVEKPIPGEVYYRSENVLYELDVITIGYDRCLNTILQEFLESNMFGKKDVEDNAKTVLEKKICVEPTEKKTTASIGDAGGPLLCEWFMSGVSNMVIHHGRKRFVNLFADVTEYIDWINEVLRKINATELSVIHTIRTKNNITKLLCNKVLLCFVTLLMTLNRNGIK